MLVVLIQELKQLDGPFARNSILIHLKFMQDSQVIFNLIVLLKIYSLIDNEQNYAVSISLAQTSLSNCIKTINKANNLSKTKLKFNYNHERLT